MIARKNIGVLTLHCGYNEGAILQSFCVTEHLRSAIPGATVEIVDHRYLSTRQAYGHWQPRDEREKALGDFIDHSLPLSGRRFESDDHVPTYEYVAGNYDALVTGSDELWKVHYTSRLLGLKREQIDPWCPAFPNAYWADESLHIPKIAYAASIGKTDWRSIPRKHRMKMKAILQDYALLGIRDRRTMQFLEWLDAGIAGRAEWVPDPTFSVDILSRVDKDALRRKLEGFGVNFNQPRVGTVVDDSPLTNTVLQELKQKGYQIVAITLPNRSADVALYNQALTPLEWAATFGLMDFCVSLRMHACIFSILNGTPFIAVDFYQNNSDSDSKLKHLLESLGLDDFYCVGDLGWLERLRRMCADIIEGRWPSGTVAEKRAMFRSRSREFAEKIRGVISNG